MYRSIYLGIPYVVLDAQSISYCRYWKPVLMPARRSFPSVSWDRRTWVWCPSARRESSDTSDSLLWVAARKYLSFQFRDVAANNRGESLKMYSVRTTVENSLAFVSMRFLLSFSTLKSRFDWDTHTPFADEPGKPAITHCLICTNTSQLENAVHMLEPKEICGSQTDIHNLWRKECPKARHHNRAMPQLQTTLFGSNVSKTRS